MDLRRHIKTNEHTDIKLIRAKRPPKLSTFYNRTFSKCRRLTQRENCSILEAPLSVDAICGLLLNLHGETKNEPLSHLQIALSNLANTIIFSKKIDSSLNYIYSFTKCDTLKILEWVKAEHTCYVN